MQDSKEDVVVTVHWIERRLYILWGINSTCEIFEIFDK